MAPSRSSSNDSKILVPSLEEIIFSCGICQATVADLYPANGEKHESHSNQDDGMGTKLWIANCVHVFCGRHLDGGGVPFHSSSQPSQAICPVCVRNDNNHEVRNVYGIRGLQEGEFDSAIPRDYVKCPPVSLDGAQPGVEALRFQYSRMKIYSQDVTRRWKSADRKRRSLESTLHKERKQHRKLEAEHEALQKRHEEVQEKLEGWEGRKEKIKRYTAAVADMASDIRMMREELSQLGYDIELKTYGLEELVPAKDQQRFISHPLESSTTLVDEQHRTSSSKRKRADYDAYPDDQQIEKELARDDSREMPPPPLPLHKAPQQPLLSGQQAAPFLRPQVARSKVDMVPKGSNWWQQPFHGFDRGHVGAYDVPRVHVELQPAFHPTDQWNGILYRPSNARASDPFDRAAPSAQRSYAPTGNESTGALHREMQQASLQDSTAPTDYYGAEEKQMPYKMSMMAMEDLHSPTIIQPTQQQRASMQAPAPARRQAQLRAYDQISNPPRSRALHRGTEKPTASILSPFFRSDEAPMREPSSRILPKSQRITRHAVDLPKGTFEARLGIESGRPQQTTGGIHNAFSREGQYRVAQHDREVAHGNVSAPYHSSDDLRYDTNQAWSPQLYSRSGPTLPNAQSSQPRALNAQTRFPGRITLPPASRTQRSWDPQVSQVRGVRGAGPLASQRAGSGMAAPYSSRGPQYRQMLGDRF